MAKIHRLLHNGMYILPETVTDAVLDNQMQRTLTELLNDKLSAVEADTAEGEITFEAGLTANGKGVVANGDGVTATKVVTPVGEIKQLTADKITTDRIESADYLGDTSGFKLANVNGDSYLEVDKLSVRKKAIFTELDIKRLDHIGGATVTSPASCRIDKVGTYYSPTDMITSDGEVFAAADSEFTVLSNVAGGYKCYFKASDGERAINNNWKVGDQAMCHAFNLTTPRYYWRLVIAVSTEIEDGYHWVALSSSDCDADSDEPMAEDVIACFGNRTDTDRQQVIITNSEGVNSPYIQQLKGINSYNITDANVVTQLSPSKNIIRGEQIELSTSSGNKGVQDLANDALKSAKTYTDTAFGNAKDYTDTSVGSAKEYADGVLGSAKEYADNIKALANSYTDDALGSAKEYADGVLDDAKGYADGVGSSALTNAKTYADGVGSSTLNNAKTYADGVGTNTLNSAKTYADGVGDDAEANAKKYADGVGTSVTTSVKGYADGLFADSKNYTQEREEYLQSQITANANGIGLCATKTELKTVSDGVDTLATRVTEAEASIKVNADGITALAEKTEVDITNLGTRISQAEASIKVNADNIKLKANQTDLESVENSVGGLTTRLTTAESQISQNADAIAVKASKMEVQGQFDNLQVGQRNYAPNTSVAITAYQFRDCYYPDNFRGKTAKITYRATYNITALPSGSYAGIQALITYNDGTQSWIGAGVNDGITVGTATNKLIKKTIAFENKKVLRFRVYCQFKDGATGTFSIDQLMVNPDTFADWSPAPEDTADSIDKLGTRVITAESSLTVQADRISSVVSEIEAMVVDYTFADFIVGEMTWVDTSEGVVIGYNDDVSYHWLRIKDVKKGDVIRFETSDYIGALTYSIIGSDGDAEGTESVLIRDQNPIVDQYTWLGKQLFEINHDNEEISETLIPMDCGEVYVYTSDDWGNMSKTKVTHIKAKITAQSRIDQTADNIRLKVGEAGINLDNQNITLTASKTTINGDLAVGVVKCYYDEAKTQLRSAYNGNGDGTIVYYYPNGQVMRKDSFVTDTSGNVLGMKTTYYKADGSVAWVLSEGGIQTTLSDYWEAINGGNALAYTDSTTTMMDICKQYLGEAMRYFSSSQFSRFVSQSGNYKAYNGKVAKGLKSSEPPKSVTLYSGVLVYSIELVEDGVLPVYQVAYEQVTTALNQLSLIMTKKFNSLGEVS